VQDLTQKAIAGICDVSPTRIRQLVAEKAITKNARGKFSESAITEYIRFLRRSHSETKKQEKSDRDLLDQEKYRAQKRENDLADGLIAPVEDLGRALEKGVAAMIPVLEALPLNMKRLFPELTGEQVQLVKQAIAECRNSLADLEIDLDG
jgi:phage terminase Nu1 subunit (DNA packaging protein)